MDRSRRPHAEPPPGPSATAGGSGPAEAIDLPLSELLAAQQLEEDGPQIDLRDLLHRMVDRCASDLHLKVGSPPGLRIDGTLRALEAPPLRPADTEELARQMLSREQWERFEREGDLDLSFALADVSRFRVNLMTQRRSTAIVVRRIPNEIPTLEELGLPDACRLLAERSRGLVLVTGPTGSGKSTTLAAMVDHVNETRACHIITMEDPIEFTHADKSCWITQREIGTDAESFHGALKRALRQDPDVLLVGEMRDLETISLALTAAETGHLVFATLHTTSAPQTIHRIVDVFPADQQMQIRMQLADSLQGIVSQTLLPRRNGRGRVAAMELLIANDGVRAMIREGKAAQIRNLMQTGGRAGMTTLETSLNRLVAAGEITLDVALAKASFPNQIARGGSRALR